MTSTILGKVEESRVSGWAGAAFCTLLFTARILVAGAAPAPAVSAGDESLLAAALVVAGKVSVPRMRAEENLTWQSDQLEQLARLYGKAGRLDMALEMIRHLDTPDRVKAPALAQIAVAALQAGDQRCADQLIRQLAAMDEWTAPAALASIARALHAAGDRERALRLAGEVRDPLERGRLALDLGGPEGLRDALDAASQIAPDSDHVLREGGPVWQDDFSERQSFLLQVLGAAVDRGEPGLARQALQKLGQVEDHSLFVWRARGLLEIARGERAAGRPDAEILRQALAEVEAARPQTLGDLRDQIDLLATLAGHLGTDQGGQVLQRAGEIARQVESVPEPAIRDTFICEMLSRLAAAWMELGRPQEARELLARAARTTEAMTVDRVQALTRIAAGFEQAGDSRTGAAVLARAVKEIGGIKEKDGRQHAWSVLVEAYDAAGLLDRALEILGASSAPVDTHQAVAKCAELLPAPQLVRLEPLVSRLPAGFLKVQLLAKIAAQLAEAGRHAEATRQMTAALSALATKFEGWDRALIRLANEIPEAARPADSEQRKVLKTICWL